MNTNLQHRILVVDDEPSIRQTTLLLLNHAGYQCDTAEDGFDALLQLERTTYAVIISDLNMPRMSGFEFLSVVRRRFPEVPVIAVSGAYQSGDSVPGGGDCGCFLRKGPPQSAGVADNRGRIARERSGAIGEAQRAFRARVDTAQRKRLQWRAVYRAHLHSMPAFVPLKREKRRGSRDSRGAMYVLLQARPLHY
jgi:CheY-like chemotaxis protein